MEGARRSDALRCLRDVAKESGHSNAFAAMTKSLELLGTIDRASVEIMATFEQNGREQIAYDDPADLDAYDAAYSQGGCLMGCPAELVERFGESAKRMYFSKSSIAHFQSHATPGQLKAVCGLLDFEMGCARRTSGAA